MSTKRVKKAEKNTVRKGVSVYAEKCGNSGNSGNKAQKGARP